MNKFVTCVSLVVCLMFAGAATADPVDYLLTSDGDAIGGTLTFDTDFAPTSSSGGIDTYTYPNVAIPAFSFYRDGSAASFDETDDVWELYLTMDASDDTPLSLKIDIDDTGGEFIFVKSG